jgi:hypothetical protein
MIKVSCITYRPRSRVVVIREDFVDICGGNQCAAAILNMMVYWHEIKLSQRGQAIAANNAAELHGDSRSHYEGLDQWHTSQDIQDALIGTWGISKIRAGVQLLGNLGFVAIKKNPNPRYKFDRTNFFRVQPALINQAIQALPQPDHMDSLNLTNRALDLTHGEPKLTDGALISTVDLSITTPETTPKITPEEREDTHTRREDSPSDLWEPEPEAGTGQADPSPAKPDQNFPVDNKNSGDGKKGPPAAVEVLVNNSTDDQFLNGHQSRLAYRQAQGKRNAINPEVFPTVEAQDEFWSAAIARIMVENPNQQIGKAKAIASGYVKQLNTGENVNPEARQFYSLWKTGGIASAPHVTTAKAAKRQNLYTNFLEA